MAHRAGWSPRRCGPGDRAGLVAIAFAGFLLAAMATAGVLVPAGWWVVSGLAGAASSGLLLSIAFSPTLLLGFAIDIAVAWLVLAGPWTPVGA